MSNIKVIKDFAEQLEKKNLKKLAGYLSEGCKITGTVPTTHGKYSMLGTWAGLFRAFPDWSYNVRDIWEEGKEVVARIAPSGTHTNDLFIGGAPLIPATGRKISQSEYDVRFVLRGKKIEQIILNYRPGQGLGAIIEELSGSQAVNRAQQYKYLVQRFNDELFNKANFDVLEELVHPKYRLHDPYAQAQVIGHEGLRQFITGLRSSFPDFAMNREEIFVEGDRVMIWWIARGTHQGVYGDIQPTGKFVRVDGSTIIRMQDGKVAEAWTNWDYFGLLSQLGVVPLEQAGSQSERYAETDKESTHPN